MRWSLAAAVLAMLASGPAGAQLSLARCRDQLLIAENIPSADDFCQRAVAEQPNDGEARVFRAGTRLLRIAAEQEDGDDPATITDSVKEMMDVMGLSPEGRSLYHFQATLPKNERGWVVLPRGAPTGGEVQDALARLLVEPIGRWPSLSPLDASLVDLAAVGPDTVFVLTSADLLALGVKDSITEIDFGDIKLFEAGLHAVKASLLLTLAMDLDFEPAPLTPIKPAFSIQTEIIDANENLFRLHDVFADRRLVLAEANRANRAAIDAYLAASAFIRAETDPQIDDLTTIPETRRQAEADLRQHLVSLRRSMDGPSPVLQGFPSTTARVNRFLGTEFGSGGAELDLGLFYDVSPFDLRDMLPPIAFDPTRRRENHIANGTFPDPTFNGILLPAPEPNGLEMAAVAILTGLYLVRWRRRSGCSP